MSIPFENIEPGKCYLMEIGHVRRVIRVMPDRRIQYEGQVGYMVKNWRAGIQEGRSFARRPSGRSLAIGRLKQTRSSHGDPA